MEIGYGSQYWKLDGTPMGKVWAANLFSFSEPDVPSLKRAHSWSSSAPILDSDSGVDVAGTFLNVCA
ncbi:unannotated protein [freshwater metagenome]|uniref:Unannotated protein n=1 Tax=freshwater metagenome TaxID=449393 RepID=A0A6J7HHR3_9ZZZZ